jgi:hypothetical protein
MVPAADDAFGRRYVATILCGDSVAFRALTKPATTLLPKFDAMFGQIRNALPKGTDPTVELRAFEVTRQSGSPAATKLVYMLRSATDSMQLMLWVEQSTPTIRYVETVGFTGFSN